VQLLATHRGNVAAVARAMDGKRTSVQRLMARLGIDRRSTAPADDRDAPADLADGSSDDELPDH
jgi:hypothetical protein